MHSHCDQILNRSNEENIQQKTMNIGEGNIEQNDPLESENVMSYETQEFIYKEKKEFVGEEFVNPDEELINIVEKDVEEDEELINIVKKDEEDEELMTIKMNIGEEEVGKS
jgi:hypothetical protein